MFTRIGRTLNAIKGFSSTAQRLSEVKPQFAKHDILPTAKESLEITKSTIQKVNNLVARGEDGRLFAVVHVAGKQFKVTQEDLIIIEGHWPPASGDEIQFEKILLAGGKDFTLVGRPILPHGLVTVRAVVVEKDLGHVKPIFYKRRRKQYQRLNFYQSHLTTLRITDVIVSGKVDEPHSVTQFERI